MPTVTPCPCGSGETYAQCCGRYHAGPDPAPTAEALMRSRFSAFAVGERDYLLATWHPGSRPAELALDPRMRWTRLEIVDTVDGGLLDPAGTVEFRAYYRAGAVRGELHERSRFTRVDGRWYYVDGDVRA